MTAKTIRVQGGKALPGLTSGQVWQAVTRASFAVLSHVTPGGEPRSSGVVYKASGRRLVVAFRTFGIGVSLRTMLNPAAARARVPVTPEGDAR